MKNKALFTINPKSKQEFFILWVSLLNVFLSIRKKEILVLAKIIEKHHELSKTMSDQDELAGVLFSTKIRVEIREELELDELNFNNILCGLRRKKLILKNKINPKLIPQLDNLFKSFKLSYDITIRDNNLN